MKKRILLLLLAIALLSGCGNPAGTQREESPSADMDSSKTSEASDFDTDAGSSPSVPDIPSSEAAEDAAEDQRADAIPADANLEDDITAVSSSQPSGSVLSTSSSADTSKASAAGTPASENAKAFFAGTNLSVQDWKMPAVSLHSSQTYGTMFIDANGNILGTLTSGKVNYDGTGYSYDVQGAIDAFNDYRGVERKALQQGIASGSGENTGASGNAASAKAEQVDTAAYAQEVIRLVNKERVAAGLNELDVDSDLMALAATRAEELAVSFSHVRPDGSKVSDMGYGENIYSGKKTASGAVNWWMNSDGHKQNILRDGITSTGAACYQDTTGTLYWVQIFAY